MAWIVEHAFPKVNLACSVTKVSMLWEGLERRLAPNLQVFDFSNMYMLP